MLTHISNNYLFSTVHSSLANSLAKKGIKRQFVYSPLQLKAIVSPAVKSDESIVVTSPRIFNKLVRYLPLTKVFFSFFYFLWTLRKHSLKPTFIIAHNLWSDGMVAFLYHKLTGVEYTVAVRDSDINFFLPKLRVYHYLISRVSKNAKKVIFINNAYTTRLEENFPRIAVSNTEVIYNGVLEDWLLRKPHLDNNVRAPNVCYVGSFIPRKNLKNSAAALSMLRQKYPDLTFIAIGGTEEEFLSRTGMTEIPAWIRIIPKTQDRELIAHYLRSARVFLMPSFTETFGLVYVEALSQGCCLVHSKNEGIDGVFDEPFIQRVDPHDPDEICQKVDTLLTEYPSGVPMDDVNKLIGSFSWDYIAEQYLKIIKEGTN